MRKLLVLLLTTLLVFVTAISGIACDVSDENGNVTADTTAPMISGVIISDITETTATISWTTNESATSNILYGPTTNYGLYYHSTLDTSADKTSHSLTLSGLLSNTTYHFQVKSEDTTGNEAISEDQIFMTKEADTTTPVIFPDVNLEAAIREATGILQGDIYQDDLIELTDLDASERDIADITGLEHCTSLTNLNLDRNQISDLSPISFLIGLTNLSLGGNQISDLSPLSSLPSLTYLYLDGNQISDLSPLSSLTSLTELYLYVNQISNLSPLSSLTSLFGLDLYGNQISDLLPLSSLTSLTYLYLDGNQISDLSPLSSLINLTGLYLGWNQINDLDPLLSNPGLGQGDNIDLTDNPLSTTSLNTYIPTLEASGVEISY